MHVSLQLKQVIGSIFVDSATRAPVAKVILILSRSIHAFRVKMLMEMVESTTNPQHVFLYAFRSGPMLARTHTLAHARIPESMLFRNLGHRFAWTLTIYFSGTKIRPASPSCVPCFPVPHALGPGVHGLDLPTIAAVQRYASRNRCVPWPPEGPCPVNVGSIRERRGNMTSR